MAKHFGFHSNPEEQMRSKTCQFKLIFNRRALKSMDWFLYDKDLRHERVNFKAKTIIGRNRVLS